jgi:hypothetical protein
MPTCFHKHGEAAAKPRSNGAHQQRRTGHIGAALPHTDTSERRTPQVSDSQTSMYMVRHMPHMHMDAWPVVMSVAPKLPHKLLRSCSKAWVHLMSPSHTLPQIRDRVGLETPRQ